MHIKFLYNFNNAFVFVAKQQLIYKSYYFHNFDGILIFFIKFVFQNTKVSFVVLKLIWIGFKTASIHNRTDIYYVLKFFVKKTTTKWNKLTKLKYCLTKIKIKRKYQLIMTCLLVTKKYLKDKILWVVGRVSNCHT